jgi:hypothetical protein
MASASVLALSTISAAWVLAALDNPGGGLLGGMGLAGQDAFRLGADPGGPLFDVGDDPLGILGGPASEVGSGGPGRAQDGRRLFSDGGHERVLVEHRRPGRPLLGRVPGGLELVCPFAQGSDLGGDPDQESADF